MVFSNVIANEGGEVTNQKHSGRCWLFALTNVLRVEVMKNLNLGPFQLSQSYLFFYDHLSKANWFLEQVIDTADEPIEERVVQHILNTGKMEAQDGGQYDMAVNLSPYHAIACCTRLLTPPRSRVVWRGAAGGVSRGLQHLEHHRPR